MTMSVPARSEYAALGGANRTAARRTRATRTRARRVPVVAPGRAGWRTAGRSADVGEPTISAEPEARPPAAERLAQGQVVVATIALRHGRRRGRAGRSGCRRPGTRCRRRSRPRARSPIATGTRSRTRPTPPRRPGAAGSPRPGGRGARAPAARAARSTRPARGRTAGPGRPGRNASRAARPLAASCRTPRPAPRSSARASRRGSPRRSTCWYVTVEPSASRPAESRARTLPPRCGNATSSSLSMKNWANASPVS